MIVINDQIGNKITLSQEATRIICLVPSLTELLIDMGIKKSVVGRTKFCVFPEDVKSILKVGGTKRVDIEKIKALKPDLVICNKEENTKEIVDSLSPFTQVYVSNIQSIHSALTCINDIGVLCGIEKAANELIEKIEISQKQWLQSDIKTRTCLYLIWKDPFMAVGIDTFIHHMLQEMNFVNVLYDFRYPVLESKDITSLAPEYLLLSSEPFPFKEKHLVEIQDMFPKSKVVLVDGTYFSWYGSRLLHAYSYFNSLDRALNAMEGKKE